jgi:hypothetical protein
MTAGMLKMPALLRAGAAMSALMPLLHSIASSGRLPALS